ncbi:MAG TPA: sigma-70 family RNA polymerase sigma factor [Thermoanaerobaculia bacterium]|nr:sigma-70 family RNA polymerase sigma factor [Thermoanaerobaculia bacterium]
MDCPVNAPFAYPLGVISWVRPAPRAAARDDPDAADVARARAGDEAAFERLVSRHEAALYRLAWRMLGRREEALDAVQEAFLRVFRGLGSYRGEAAFRTWATGIAINVCRNRLAAAETRASRRSRSLDAPAREGGELREPALPDPSPGPEAEARGAELRRALGRALAELTPEHRAVLLLCEMQGLSYEEAAAALGCRLGTVRSRLARARGALRERLEGIWP